GGGNAVAVTQGGGVAPFESRDGVIYYVKGPQEGGIWRVPIASGNETRVIDGPTPGFWGYWALLENGIWFATQEPPLRSRHAMVHFFDFATRRAVDVGPLDTYAVAGFPFFAMTPDGKSIVYVKNKPETSDIMLVNNFR